MQVKALQANLILREILAIHFYTNQRRVNNIQIDTAQDFKKQNVNCNYLIFFIIKIIPR